MPVPVKRGQDTIVRLLDAALAVYSRRGRDGFTLQAVLDASGVSVGSLYHHFGSLDGLGLALYNRCMDDLMDHLVDGLKGCATAEEGVRAMVTVYLRWTADAPTKALVLHAAAYPGSPPGHAERATGADAPKVEVIGEWFAPHIASGALDPMPPFLLETLVLGPPRLVAQRWLAGVPGFDLDEAIALLPDRVWRSVRGKKT